MRLSWTAQAGMVFLAGSLSGCGAMAEAVDAPSLDGTAWVLAGLPGHALVAGAIPTLQFGGGRVGRVGGARRLSRYDSSPCESRYSS
jgi:hypothetical protein